MSTGQPAAVRGLVSFPVKAERGSRLAVLEGTQKVASATANGAPQVVSFRASNGNHSYTVQAKDAADNVSSLPDFDLNVDTIAPAKAQITVTPPTGLLAYTTVAILGEAGAHYAVRVARRTTGTTIASLNQDGSLDSAGLAAVALLAGDGAYNVAVALSDAGQNSSPAATSPVTVTVPPPTLALARSSAPSSATNTLTLEGPALGSGTITLVADGPSPVTTTFTLDDTGHTTANVELADGLWAADATVADFQHRTALTSRTGLLVDTVAPTLEVKVDQKAASNRRVRSTFVVEPDVTVTVTGLPGADRTFSDAGPATLDSQQKDGTYTLTFGAVDLAGNETLLKRQIRISHPLTLSEGLAGGGTIATLTLGLFFIVRAWRVRRYDRQAKRERRRLERAHAHALAAHQTQLLAHQGAVTDHRHTHATWVADGIRLGQHALEARTYDGYDLDLPAGTKARPGEALYSHVEQGGLVELRRPSGVDRPTVVEQGEIWVTNSRVLFAGDKTREWSFDKLEQTSTVGADITMMSVANRKTPSGISYPGHAQAIVRRHLELAQATHAGTRDRLVAEADDRVVAHQRHEPQPPGSAPVEPPAPFIPSADDLRRADEARKNGGLATATAPVP